MFLLCIVPTGKIDIFINVFCMHHSTVKKVLSIYFFVFNYFFYRYCIFHEFDILSKHRNVAALFYRGKNMELTKSELEIMNVLWGEDRPLSRNDIITLSTDRTWKESSIHILLNGLLKKGAIVESGFIRCGKTFGRLYAANVSYDEYYEKNVFNGGGSNKVLPLLISSFINKEDVTAELMDELETMIQRRKSELEK